MILKVLILSSILLGLAFVGLAFRVLFVRDGRFPQISIGKNKEMARLGISCVKHDEYKCWKQGGTDGPGCGCS
ncbi:MAG TPA: hypothetical protein ENI20_04130 [Bacteroides sp.]|nr:hypothetical protein [Bacteroides sp.]